MERVHDTDTYLKKMKIKEKIISEMDDLKAMMKEVTLNNFEENFEEDE